MTQDEIRELIDAANQSGPLEILPSNPEPMVMIPLEQYRQMLPVATVAKYFHYVECDGQKFMMGFQTYREMLMHMIVSESDNDRANTLCALLAEVDGTATDSPTIREAASCPPK